MVIPDAEKPEMKMYVKNLGCCKRRATHSLRPTPIDLRSHLTYYELTSHHSSTPLHVSTNQRHTADGKQRQGKLTAGARMLHGNKNKHFPRVNKEECRKTKTSQLFVVVLRWQQYNDAAAAAAAAATQKHNDDPRPSSAQTNEERRRNNGRKDATTQRTNE